MNISRLFILIFLFFASLAQVSYAKECRKANMLNSHRGFSNIRIQPSVQPLKLEQSTDYLRNEIKKLEFNSLVLKRFASLDEYVDKNCTNALLVVKDGRLVYEKYSQWTGVNDKLYSASMAKTLTSIMIGILIDEKKLELTTKASDIYPELAQSAFSNDTVEDLLRMNSSAKLRDCYEDCSDGDNQRLNPQISPRTNTLEYLSQKIEKGQKPFFYSGANTALLGLMIKKLSGKHPAEFWHEKVWSQVGAESDGYWIVNNGKELGFQCCYTATARDWVKIGIMLANYGEINQQKILSKEYVEAMASGNIAIAQPQGRRGYGLHVWTPRNTPRADMKTIEMIGAYGQFLVVDPITKIVIFHSGNGRSENAPFEDWNHLRYAIQGSMN